MRGDHNMKYGKMLAVTVAAVGLIGLAACSKDYVGKENSHPLFAKAMSYKTSQNYLKAAESYEGFLVQCPKSARTHRELAELYGDYLNDYLKAAYHYEKYMEYASLSNADRQDTRRLVDALKLKFYEAYQKESGLLPPEPPQDVVKELEEVKQQLDGQKQINTKIAERFKELHIQYKAALKQNADLRSQSGRTAAASTVRTSAPSSTASSAGGSVYVVVAGDSLSRIANKFNLGRNGVQKLRDANPSIKRDRIRAGQKINIPGAAAPALRQQTVAPAPQQTTTPVRRDAAATGESATGDDVLDDTSAFD